MLQFYVFNCFNLYSTLDKMAPYIVCNYKKCRKPLQIKAWVTSCSHTFCMEHGEFEFSNPSRGIVTCPACNVPLNGKYDLVLADLDPPEGFKSIVLAGMKPDIVMDVAMRSLAFWTYQIEEETRYQENTNRQTQDKIKNMEEFNCATVQNLKKELLTVKNKLDSVHVEFDKRKRQADEYSVRLEEKEKKILKLQHELFTLRRNSCRINEFDKLEQKRNLNSNDLVTSKHPQSNHFELQLSSPMGFRETPQSFRSAKRDDDEFTFSLARN